MQLDAIASYRRAPLRIWHQLLAGTQRVVFDEDLQLWLIIGHDPVRTALSDTHQFSNADTLTPVAAVADDVAARLAAIDAPPVSLTADPPTHVRTSIALRSVMPQTEDRAEQRFGGIVRHRVNEAVEQVAANATNVDLVEQFNRRLPLLILLDVIGMPARNAARVQQWTTGYLRLLGDDLQRPAQRHAAHCADALWHYCRTFTTTRFTTTTSTQEHPEDLLTRLIRYRAGDDERLTQPEIAAMLFHLLVAGIEPTAALIGHAIEHALREPPRWARLSTEPGYGYAHVEETLRHTPPIDGWLRTTTTDVLLDGVTIPAGARCLLLIGTANHDPAAHTNPHLFDPDRTWIGNHLSFGTGAHRCVGAGLARLTAVTAVTALARRLPNLRLKVEHQRPYLAHVLLRIHRVLPATAPRCPVTHATVPAS